MNCAFCGRGTAQNLNITKEIIDKTFDELKDVYIDNLRIHGGEPFLAPEMMEYLITKIIDKHIYVNVVCMFTNGTKIQPELIAPFNRLLRYLVEVEQEMRHIVKWSNHMHENLYVGTDSAKFAIIVSEYEHNSDTTEINDFIKFYQQIDNDNMVVVKQSDTYDDSGRITFEGNALKNYKQFLSDPVQINDMRILNNNYYFVKKCSDDKKYGAKSPIMLNGLIINKTLTVSANGNVFPGCIMSYERVDASPMFNILNCNGDFFDNVVNFCWKYPIGYKARNQRNIFLAIEFCKEKNLKVQSKNIPMKPEDYAFCRMLDVFAVRQEDIARDLHTILPALWFDEIDAISTAMLVLNMFDRNVELEIIKYYLKYCSEFDDETIKNISPEWCRGFILFLSEKDRKRRKNLDE